MIGQSSAIVLEDIVRPLNSLQFSGALFVIVLLISPLLVGMPLPRQLSVGLLNFVGRCIGTDVQYCVEFCAVRRMGCVDPMQFE